MAQQSHKNRKGEISINLRLILETPQEPSSKKRYLLSGIGGNKRIFALGSIKSYLVVGSILLLPISVSAGLIDAIGGIFSKTADADSLNFEKNLQSMRLLASAGTPFSENEFGYDRIVNDSALIASEGPGGTMMDALIHKPSSDQISVYIVREGDTISQIAEMFDVDINTIKWSNDLTSSVLREGQTLVILPVSGIKHIVVKGDTLDSITKKYKGDKAEIISYNGLSSAPLSVGSTIIIPDGEIVANVQSSGTSVSVGTKTTLKDTSGYFIRPISGGKRSQGIHGYNAVDIAAPVGTPIYAAAGGEVIISRSGGWNGGYGTYIVIKHSNGTQTLYAHNSKNNVSTGDTVKQGEIIGAVGSTGKVTGSHLHFEVRGAKNPF